MNAVPATPPNAQPSELLAQREGDPDDAELARWQELLGQVGRELAEPLTAALERVTTLTTTGRIDRAGLRALRDEVDRARQAGIWCQQISRLASGRIRQSQERVHLTNTIQSVLAYRAREMHAKGLQLKQALLPIEIQADASMLFGLLNALVDWLLDCAHGTVDMRVDTRNWPVRAQLTCTFQHHALDELPPNAEARQARINTMHWHLLAQTARTLGLVMDRQIDPSRVQLHLEFPGTIAPNRLEDETQADNHGFADSVNSKPLAGSHVLVIASRRDLRLQIREALKSMGLVLDFVGSVREAAEFCREGLPHAIVFESELRTGSFDQLVSGIRQEVPEFVFIELTKDGKTFDISSISATGMARVGCEGIANALPSALVYELSRVL
ncbi:MAG TPA: hypothetical protein VFW93_03250 [Aquabacterium sp.]|uniref:hypothetical protein n=1 Tax=Aquabacterium sp. TaxID=1872578 RepID=UPI002E35D400|nr:hypothetical protein [Aquabacterium sp.]HEX5355208.1 hypothetical protein [Aquabacterium sp.]